MIPDNYEYLLEFKGYSYYVLQEVGFSNKEWADNNGLYQDFGDGLPSGFKDIYTTDLYKKKTISQICIAIDEKPIGMCMGIHNPVSTKDSRYGFTVNVLGNIELYLHDNHRNRGLAAFAVPLLESLLQVDSKYPCAIIMQQAAYGFGKYLKTAMAVPNAGLNGKTMGNRNLLAKYFTELGYDTKKLNQCLKKFPGFREEYNLRPIKKLVM